MVASACTNTRNASFFPQRNAMFVAFFFLCPPKSANDDEIAHGLGPSITVHGRAASNTTHRVMEHAAITAVESAEANAEESVVPKSAEKYSSIPGALVRRELASCTT